MPTSKTDSKEFTPSSAADWRNWLAKNHELENSVWLIYYKKTSGKPTVAYSDAVDEALCFGWIDSKAQSIDEHRYRQFFCKRKKDSVWSRVNKAKIEQLIAANKMMPAGLKSIEIAKENGSWTILDQVEALEIPNDMQAEFEQYPNAANYFEAFSRSDKRNILQWIQLAKKEETRMKRIKEAVALADRNEKPKQFTVWRTK